MNWLAKKRSASFILSVLFSLCLSGCGGGGGGGEGGEAKNSSAETGVRLLHAALDSAPISLSADGTAAPLQKARFSERTLYASLGAGPHIVGVAVTGSGENFSMPLEITKKQRYSVLVYGSPAWSGGLKTALIDDSLPEISSGEAAIKVVHAVHGALNLLVSIDGVPADGFIGYGDSSTYHGLPAGAHALTFYREADGKRLGIVQTDFAPGKSYTVLGAGEIGYFVTFSVVED